MPVRRPGEFNRDAPNVAEAAPVVPVVAKPEEKKPEEKAQPTPEDRAKELEAQVRRTASERMKLAHEARKAREEATKREELLAAREAKLKSWEAEHADRKRNPAKYLQADYGENWYDKLSQVKLSGSPPAELIASELDDRSKSWEAKLSELDAKWAKKWEERDQVDAQRSKEAEEHAALSYVTSNAEKYPLVHAFEVQGNINAVIEAHFNATCTRDEVTGEVVPGEMWTAEQAATEMEKHLSEKYQKVALAKQPKASPPPVASVAPRVSTPQRRTLSTDMSAASPTWTPPKDDRERAQRAEAAWNAQKAARN